MKAFFDYKPNMYEEFEMPAPVNLTVLHEVTQPCAHMFEVPDNNFTD